MKAKMAELADKLEKLGWLLVDLAVEIRETLGLEAAEGD